LNQNTLSNTDMKIGANFPAKTPEGPIEDKWTSYKNKIDLVNPAN